MASGVRSARKTPFIFFYMFSAWKASKAVFDKTSAERYLFCRLWQSRQRRNAPIARQIMSRNAPIARQLWMQSRHSLHMRITAPLVSKDVCVSVSVWISAAALWFRRIPTFALTRYGSLDCFSTRKYTWCASFLDGSWSRVLTRSMIDIESKICVIQIDTESIICVIHGV